EMGKLDGKTALVTGASKGIGAGVALSLAKEGAAVAVNYASDREGADRVIEKIKAFSGKAVAVQGSVTSSEEIDRFFDTTEEQLGNAIKALTPLGRTGMPEDIGLIAAFLASDEARWLTGEIIFGSGGLC